jgi:hypothetical protein
MQEEEDEVYALLGCIRDIELVAQFLNLLTKPTAARLRNPFLARKLPKGVLNS